MATEEFKKKYTWPDPDRANGSGDLTFPTKMICKCLENIGELLFNLTKAIENNSKEKPTTP